MLPKRLAKSWRFSNFENLMIEDHEFPIKNFTTYGNDIRLFCDNGKNIFLMDKENNIYYFSTISDVCEENLKNIICENWGCNVFCGLYFKDNLFFDADDDYLYCYGNKIGVSFRCLEELDGKALVKLQNNKLIVKDFSTAAHTKSLSKSEVNKYEKGEKLTPPSKGYSVVKYGNLYLWHKSEYILMYDIGLKKSYLLGQDEGQYFGVELPSNPKTVYEAVEILKPKEIRNINCDRQGEWFIVPLKPEQIPGGENESTIVIDDHPSIILPREIGSNKHRLTADEIRIFEGTVYAKNSCLEHDQHESVKRLDWVKFVKNTAVRSVSVNGVD